MKTKTDNILLTMHVLAWVAVCGFIGKAGAILISYVVSINNPVGAKNMYMGLDFSAIRQYDLGQYTATIFMMVSIVLLEAYIAYLVTKALSQIKMTKPFTPEVSKVLVTISTVMLFTWIAAMIYNAHQSWLAKNITGMQPNYIPGEFILMAGVVFVLAQIFKKGVEFQTENELTV
jgi:uncharacterized membrane protein SirB2